MQLENEMKWKGIEPEFWNLLKHLSVCWVTTTIEKSSSIPNLSVISPFTSLLNPHQNQIEFKYKQRPEHTT